MARLTEPPHGASHTGNGASRSAPRVAGQIVAARVVEASVVAAPARPNLSGDLDDLLTRLAARPAFRRRSRGYDRLQVDNYVAWVETELLAARRETEDLVDRYSRCRADLETAQLAALHSSEGLYLSRLSGRIGSILQLAADEAADLTTTAVTEAERVRADALATAEADRRTAREMRELAVLDTDRMRVAAATDRAQAAAVRRLAAADVEAMRRQADDERARQDAEAAQTRARLDAEAAAVRERLDREAAELRDRQTLETTERIQRQAEQARAVREEFEAATRERMAVVHAEIAELERRRDVSRDCLARMSDQISEAVATLAADLPEPGLRLPSARNRLMANPIARFGRGQRRP